MVEVDRTEADHSAESALPGKRLHLQGELGVGLKLQSLRAGCLLILIDHQLPDEAHTVVVQPPLAVIAIGGASKRHPAENEKISPAIEKTLDPRPSLFGKRRAISENQKLRRRGSKDSSKLIDACRLRPRQHSRHLLG